MREREREKKKTEREREAGFDVSSRSLSTAINLKPQALKTISPRSYTRRCSVPVVAGTRAKC